MNLFSNVLKLPKLKIYDKTAFPKNQKNNPQNKKVYLPFILKTIV